MYKKFTTIIARCQVLKAIGVFAVSTVIDVCLNLDRVGRLYDAQQTAEITITVFNHLYPIFHICLALANQLVELTINAYYYLGPLSLAEPALFGWLLKLLIGS